MLTCNIIKNIGLKLNSYKLNRPLFGHTILVGLSKTNNNILKDEKSNDKPHVRQTIPSGCMLAICSRSCF